MKREAQISGQRLIPIPHSLAPTRMIESQPLYDE